MSPAAPALGQGDGQRPLSSCTGSKGQAVVPNRHPWSTAGRVPYILALASHNLQEKSSFHCPESKSESLAGHWETLGLQPRTIEGTDQVADENESWKQLQEGQSLQRGH